MLSFPVFVLGFLFVSFRPSRFRSHSCSTGASLRFRFRFSSGLFRSPSASFRPLPLASDYSAFRSFFSPLPDLPCAAVLSVRFGFFRPRPFPLPFRLFPCVTSDSSTQLPAISFLRVALSCHRHLRSFRPPVSSSAAPLGFRFRFGLLGF